MTNNELTSEKFFYSYNCFNSCLGTLLKDYFKWGINLALHSNWQFFYSKTWLYDNDNRFTGEYPHPYDLSTFSKLNNILGVHVKVSDKNLNNATDIISELSYNGKFIVLVNKYFFDRYEGRQKPVDLLTTAIIDRYNPIVEKIHYYLGDDNFSSCGWIDISKFLMACKYAPHGYKINGLLFNMGIKELDSEKDIESKRKKMVRTAISDIVSSANEYIVGRREENTWYGAPAIKIFAEDILTWQEHPMLYETRDNIVIFKRLIDCAIYLEFVRKQREVFTTALSEISETILQRDSHKCNWINQIEDITKKWTYLKFMLFLAGSRKQLGALKNISIEINSLYKSETEFMEDIYVSLDKVVYKDHLGDTYF